MGAKTYSEWGENLEEVRVKLGAHDMENAFPFRERGEYQTKGGEEKEMTGSVTQK